MTYNDDFGSPDRQGFALLLKSPFVVWRNLLFRKSQPRLDEIDRLLKDYSEVDVQRYVNHVSLALYVGDICLQRAWAEELVTEWRQRLSIAFPSLSPQFNVEDDGLEVVVSVWVEPSQICAAP